MANKRPADGGDGAGSRPSAAMPAHEEIAQLAYALWESRGAGEGTPDEDWFEAERQLRAESSLEDEAQAATNRAW